VLKDFLDVLLLYFVDGRDLKIGMQHEFRKKNSS
jgi:hypothetical protein